MSARILLFAATWKTWAGATQVELLNSPPVFKPAHVLFPLADGNYRAERNEQVNYLRWEKVRDEVPQPDGLVLPKHQRWNPSTGGVIEVRPEQPGDWDEVPPPKS